MKTLKAAAMALALSAATVAAFSKPSAAADDQSLTVAVSVSPEPPHVGHAYVVVHVTDAQGQPVRLHHGELFVSWWDPTIGPLQAPPTPMTPMGVMPQEHVIVNARTGPSHYVIPVVFSRSGHWALVFHAMAAGGSYVTASRDVIVAK
jgi:hypothetical protein